LLAGQLPFRAKNAAQKLLLHQTTQPRPIRQHRHDLPTPISDIIHTMLEKRPEDRFQTPGVLAEALKPWAERTVPPFPSYAVKYRRASLERTLGRSPAVSRIDVTAQLRGLRPAAKARPALTAATR
jgi:serine/threonine protein kinase